MIGIGGGVNSANLACSGARTATQPFSSGSDYKPGLDFYDDGAGHIGQAKALQQYASTHNVKMVVALIGANDYGFADIVQTCVLNWYLSPSWWPNYCYDDSSISSRFTAANQAAITAKVAGAYQNLRTAMRNAGYADNAWTLVAQTYSSPIPRGSGFRYSQSGYTRQTVGGCGVWNRDADWANDTVVPALNDSIRNGVAQSGLGNVRIIEAAGALNGRRLCETRRRTARGAGRRELDERRARPTRPSGSSRCARARRCSGPTSSRRTSIRTTGVRRRCATASGRPTTTERRAAARARARRTG